MIYQLMIGYSKFHRFRISIMITLALVLTIMLLLLSSTMVHPWYRRLRHRQDLQLPLLVLVMA
jgi:flagellar motor component MotA